MAVLNTKELNMLETNCKGFKCPIKQTCKRYVHKSFNFTQRYFMDTPFDFVNKSCKWLLEVN